MFLIAQILGIFSTVSAILCVQARSSGGVLVGQILANGSAFWPPYTAF